MNRRLFLASAAALTGCATAGDASKRGPGLAITVDDFNLAADPLMSGEARDAAIRRALADHGVKGAGFAAGKYVDAGAAPRVLAAWSADGHILGNRTFSHRLYAGADPDGYMADIRQCEAVSLDHTILLHHIVTTGLFLGDALAMFEGRGRRLRCLDGFRQARIL